MDYYKLLNKNVIKTIEVLIDDRLYFNQISELTGIKSKNNGRRSGFEDVTLCLKKT